MHIVPYIGTVKLSRLSAPAVNAFRDQLLDAGRSRDMVRRVLASLAALVGEAQARGLVATNNVRTVSKTKRGKRTEDRIEMPTRDELRAIIATTPDRHRPLILTALLAGLRGSELVALPHDIAIPRLVEIVQTHQHSRYPVYEGTLDDVIGIASAKRLLAAVAAHGMVDYLLASTGHYLLLAVAVGLAASLPREAQS